jgi:hypothetical protein
MPRSFRHAIAPWCENQALTLDLAKQLQRTSP